MRPMLLAALVVGATFANAKAQSLGLKVPPGFEVVEFADGKLANDIQVMTVDPKGRVIVAGRGYVRILVDDDGDGKADRALEFADEPKDGAMGLLWEGDTLYVTGDGGLRRFTSKTGDKADGPSKLLRAMKTGGEHTSHAIHRGPDGWLYVLGGNVAGIDKSFAELPTSPVKDPIAGCVLRFHPQSAKCEIVAHGFRNPYAFDFNLEGDLFTFDSDNERCVGLPWYEPTRFYHVIEGRHYGWLNPQHAVAWRRPPYFCDVVAPIATLGRGSPTGVCCYRHNQFPSEYHGGFFLADWTFGKIHFATLKRDGASYTAQPRLFLEALGDNGFAPTACAIDPKTGDLFISIGGRGTRGAVYRVRHLQRFKALAGKLASLPMAKRILKFDENTKDAPKDELPKFLWAMQMARRDRVFAIPMGDRPFQYADSHIHRAVADLLADLIPVLPEKHRAEAAIRLAKDLEKPIRDEVDARSRRTAGLIWRDFDHRLTLDAGLSLVKLGKTHSDRLDGVRLVQLGLGDIGSKKAIGTIWEGYSLRTAIEDSKDTAKYLAPGFPSGHTDLDRELARTLGMLGYTDADVRGRILARCSADSSPIDDIHYLACYARLGGKRDAKETKLVAAALLDLDRKIALRKLNRDTNWPLRVQELYVGLAEKDATLHQAMVEHPAFGRPDHALFANTAGFPKERAARIFLQRWQKDAKFTLTGHIVQLFDKLPAADLLPTVRKRWGDTGQEAALVPLLGKNPIADDRSRFVEGLNSTQSAVVLASIEGLTKIAGKSDDAQTFALIRALHRTTDKQTALRNALTGRLATTTGQNLGADSKRWIAWFASANPELGKRLNNPDGVDVAKWDARLAKLDWDAGSADAGKSVYAKASCVHCHSGSQAVGPDLVGVTKRFSRADLFTAILQPSKDVPARYQTTVVETQDGKTYQGIVIYDAVDSLILHTGPSTTVRLDGQRVASRHVSAQSLMPAGLLDPLSDREIVDLYAYLRTLK